MYVQDKETVRTTNSKEAAEVVVACITDWSKVQFFPPPPSRFCLVSGIIKLMRKDQSGVGAIEAILLLVIVVTLTGVGYFVYKTKQNTTNSYNSASNALAATVPVSKPKTVTVQKDDTVNWKLFSSTRLVFTIRIPDGWTLYTDPTSGILLSGQNTTSITFHAGTMATVTEQTVGDDATHPFVISEGLTDTQLNSYTKVSAINASGITGTKYYYEQTTEPQAIGLPKGAKEYRYHFVKNQKTIDVTYTILPGDFDNTPLLGKWE